MTWTSLKDIVQKEILKNAKTRVVDITARVPLKLLAARSGLGLYGRNNLIFVDGMGSYNLLYAFLTDYQFPEDNWTNLSVLDRCHRCDHCDRICPTVCISRSNFGINIDKCITLYNENPGEFPNWILKSYHHALWAVCGARNLARKTVGLRRSLELWRTYRKMKPEKS
jgi:epoxyqueuosine reductase QueG